MLLGAQRPRVCSVPDYATSAGEDAIGLAESAGLILDDWQRFVLTESLGERADGKWSAFEVGLIVPRQNGKGSILEARELAGLVLFKEQLILHSAHEFKTASEAFLRVKQHFDNNDDLRKMVLRIRTSHGDEGIELRNGCRLRFVARSTGSGRGFSGDCIILDESYKLGAEAMAALLPTLSARPNPQLWYTSSTGMETSTQLKSVRDRGLAGTSPSLAFFEWSVADGANPADPESWAQSNPALGIRISSEFVAREREAMPAFEFARERLGVWAESEHDPVIDPAQWAAVADTSGARPGDPVALAIDISPDRSSSLAVCGVGPDGLPLLEVADTRPGTEWVVRRVVEIAERWKPKVIALDPRSSGSLLPELAAAGIEPMLMTAPKMAQACDLLRDSVADGKVHHCGQEVLDLALRGARKRTIGDGAWAWSRRDSTDISSLVAATVALWAFSEQPAPVAPSIHFI